MDDVFAVIEIIHSTDNSHAKTASISVKPQTVTMADGKRAVFNDMRKIGRSIQLVRSVFYNRQTLMENAKIFYKQALFMKNFEDNYAESAPFSSYYPNYQLMNYEQLRTYFTWRTNVRKNIITETSLSYVFVYIYELLNNIGVHSPEDGLDKILNFWDVYKEYDITIDKYLTKWVKDYRIFYNLPILDEDSNERGIEFFYMFSKYNIKKSKFYTPERAGLIDECIYFTINKIKEYLTENDNSFEDLLFYEKGQKSTWMPFEGALFYNYIRQKNRRVVLSENEIYICYHNNWTLNSVFTMESGRQLVSYIIKQAESELRRITKYKHKITASPNILGELISRKLVNAGMPLLALINNSVSEFIREKNKIVVNVSEGTLNKIREESLDTQEKLIVPEDGIITVTKTNTANIETITPKDAPIQSDGWGDLKNMLNPVETDALTIILSGKTSIAKYAADNNIMTEVLTDGINEKAMECVGDNILEADEEVVIYDEYIDEITKMVGMI